MLRIYWIDPFSPLSEPPAHDRMVADFSCAKGNTWSIG